MHGASYWAAAHYKHDLPPPDVIIAVSLRPLSFSLYLLVGEIINTFYRRVFVKGAVKILTLSKLACNFIQSPLSLFLN